MEDLEVLCSAITRSVRECDVIGVPDEPPAWREARMLPAIRCMPQLRGAVVPEGSHDLSRHGLCH